MLRRQCRMTSIPILELCQLLKVKLGSHGVGQAGVIPVGLDQFVAVALCGCKRRESSSQPLPKLSIA
jgi:hypothetical protein